MKLKSLLKRLWSKVWPSVNGNVPRIELSFRQQLIELGFKENRQFFPNSLIYREGDGVLVVIDEMTAYYNYDGSNVVYPLSVKRSPLYWKFNPQSLLQHFKEKELDRYYPTKDSNIWYLGKKYKKINSWIERLSVGDIVFIDHLNKLVFIEHKYKKENVYIEANIEGVFLDIPNRFVFSGNGKFGYQLASTGSVIVDCRTIRIVRS